MRKVKHAVTGRPVMIGTALGGQGGVAAVIGVHRQLGLFDRYKVRYLASHVEGSQLVKLWCGVRAALLLFWLLLTRQVALVHVHVASNGSFKRKASYLALARAFGVPTVFHLHGGGFRDFVDAQASPRLRRWIVHTIRHSTVVVALSESWASYLKELAPSADVHVIANPVAMPEAMPAESAIAGRLLYLGRASQQKGVFDLLEAVSRIRERHPEVHLRIGGDGDLEAVRSTVQRLRLEAHVELLGWVNGMAKQAELAQAQIFVLPSYNEGLPMAMLEAMANRKAVVVSAVGGIPEAVQHDQQGWLIHPGAVDELVQALVILLEDDERRRRLGEAAHRRVAERFSADHVLAQIGSLYEALGVQPRHRAEQR